MADEQNAEVTPAHAEENTGFRVESAREPVGGRCSTQRANWCA